MGQRELIQSEFRERREAGDIGGALDIWLANYELLAPEGAEYRTPGVILAASREITVPRPPTGVPGDPGDVV